MYAGVTQAVPEGLTDWGAEEDFSFAATQELLTAPRVQLQQTPKGLLISVVGRSPRWLPDTVNSLRRLVSLAPNWDLHQAPSIDMDSVVGAMELLVLVMRANTPAPSIVPTTTGGVQIEWHRKGVDAEVEVRSRERFHLFTSEAEGETEQEIVWDLTPLVEVIDRISRD